MAKRGRPKGSKNKAKKLSPNSTGKRGGQYNNKNAEKWPENKAKQLANDLINWLSPKLVKDENGRTVDEHYFNIFKIEFLAVEKKLHKDIIGDLRDKYKSFDDLLKIADNIQESKLLRLGAMGKLNSGIVCFSLKNHHGYTDKVEHSGNQDAPLTFIFQGKKK